MICRKKVYVHVRCVPRGRRVRPAGEGASAMVYTAFWASFSMPAMPVFSSVAFYLITLALIACGELSPLYEL